MPSHQVKPLMAMGPTVYGTIIAFHSTLALLGPGPPLDANDGAANAKGVMRVSSSTSLMLLPAWRVRRLDVAVDEALHTFSASGDDHASTRVPPQLLLHTSAGARANKRQWRSRCTGNL